MFEEILLPVDGSRGAKAAAQHGLSLATRDGATVHVLHVADTATAETTEDTDTIPETWVAGGDRTTHQVADQAAALGLPVVTEVRRGSPADAILDYVAERGIDLVVMGTHSQSRLVQPLVGNVTKTIVNTASVPVLCVPPAERAAEPTEVSEITYRSILVPTDGTKAARTALDRGFELAATYDATVHALYVVDRRAYASRPGWTWADTEATLEQSGKDILERVAADAASSDVPVVTAIRRGVRHQVIQNYAADHGNNLVTMGTRGRSGLSKWVLGSVTERVLRGTEIPVLTVRTR